MRNFDNRILFAAILIFILGTWPSGAQAQNVGDCYINRNSDAICDNYKSSVKQALPRPSPQAYSPPVLKTAEQERAAFADKKQTMLRDFTRKAKEIRKAAEENSKNTTIAIANTESLLACSDFSASSVSSVSNCSDLKSVAKNAKAGTEIVVKAGSYSCGSINIAASGIMLRSDGNVAFNGTKFIVSGNNNIIAGLLLNKSSIIIDKADGVRVTGNVFRGGNNAVVVQQGSNNRIDHNEFDGMTGAATKIFPNLGPTASQQKLPQNNVIDHNYYHDMENAASRETPILLGTAKSCSDCVFGTLVENNLFERMTNSYAVLLVKSSGNTIRNNTFDNSNAKNNVFTSLALRHGQNNTVQNNVLLNISLMVQGKGHRIIGNDINHHIVLGAGHVTQADMMKVAKNESVYPRAENVLVAGNKVGGRIAVGAVKTLRVAGETSLPALNTSLAGNTGRIVRELERGTTIQGSFSGGTGEATRLRPSDVGPGAGGASCKSGSGTRYDDGGLDASDIREFSGTCRVGDGGPCNGYGDINTPKLVRRTRPEKVKPAKTEPELEWPIAKE